VRRQRGVRQLTALACTLGGMSDDLATGWDALSPPDDTILRQFVTASADSLLTPLAAVGGRTVRRPAYWLADADRPSGYHAGATLLRPPAADEWPGLLDEIENGLRDGSGDAYLYSAWPTPDLRGRGWELEGYPPLLVRAPGLPLPPPGPADFEVRRVVDPAGLADWERVAVTGYPLAQLLPWRPEVLYDERVLKTPLRQWVGYADGQPVGAGASWVTDGLHVCAMGVVLPGYRGRGYWRALLRTRLADAAGLPSAGLFSDYSRPGAQRYGYLPVLRFTLWRRKRA
jgi:GNAT superfamily N-acetyltransferase